MDHKFTTQSKTDSRNLKSLDPIPMHHEGTTSPEKSILRAMVAMDIF